MEAADVAPPPPSQQEPAPGSGALPPQLDAKPISSPPDPDVQPPVAPPQLPAMELDPPAAPADAAAAEEPPSKRRKLEDVGFFDTPYFKIRTIVKDLRPLFLEVVQTPDLQNSKAANDILKQIRTALELSKQLRSELAASDKPEELVNRSSDGVVNNEPRETFHTKDKKGELPQTDQAAGLPNNSLENASERVADRAHGGAKPTESKDIPKLLEEAIQGSYVVGGSPIGWNFLVYPGSKLVYYGVTKAEWLSRQAAS